MSRRDNGQGSLYKMQDGTWRAIITDEKTGKRHYRQAKLKGAAQAKIDKLRLRLGMGLPSKDDHRTVAQFMNEWLGNHVAAGDFSKITHQNYTSFVRNWMSRRHWRRSGSATERGRHQALLRVPEG
jgi:hypothetical protein